MISRLLVATLLVVLGCGSDPSPASPSSTPAVAPRAALTDAELATLRAGVARIRPGMTRAEVFAALGVSLDGLGQLGTGPRQDTTTMYVLGPEFQLDLTWDMTTAEGTLRRAALVAHP